MTPPLFGMYWKEHKSTYKRDTCILLFIAALFTVAILWNQQGAQQQITDEWIKKIWCV
jgi:hypothetical protein